VREKRGFWPDFWRILAKKCRISAKMFSLYDLLLCLRKLLILINFCSRHGRIFGVEREDFSFLAALWAINRGKGGKSDCTFIVRQGKEIIGKW
jgi:hypothetical protein